MSAPDYLLTARQSLDALATLLREAAAQHRPAEDILEPALGYLREARQVIDSTLDEEGTE